MTIHRRNPKRDQNEPAIVAALEQIGFRVRRISEAGFADLAAYHRAYGVLLIEVKSARGRLTKAQLEHRADGWPVHIVRSVDDVLALIGVPS